MADVREIEARRIVEQTRFDQLKDADERNRWGQFATPPALAIDMAEYAWKLWRKRSEPARFLDPAIGTGSFYSAFLHVFPNDLIGNAAGVELDPDIASTASSLWKSTGLNVTVGDFTKLSAPRSNERFNLILTNPPYVRHHHLPKADKKRLKAQVAEELGIEISGLAGFYCYFLLLCDKWLAEDGLALWLIPSEFMDVNYGASVKRYLATNVRLLHIHRFCPSDVQFADALVSSAVVVFQKSASRRSHSVRFSFGGTFLAPTMRERIPLSDLRTAPKWTHYPTRRLHQTSAQADADTLADLFDIKRGLATGANSFFILPRDEALSQGIPRECVKPILPSPRHLTEPVIETYRDGYPKIKTPLSLIDCDYTEEKVRERFPDFWAYLQLGKKQNIHRGYLTSRRTPWYSQETRNPAPFLCTYMGRSGNGRQPFRLFWNQSAATAHNVYLLLYPKGILKAALESDPDLYATVFAVLQDLDTVKFTTEGRVYGGGLHKIEPKELGRVSAEPLLDTIEALRDGRQMLLFA